MADTVQCSLREVHEGQILQRCTLNLLILSDTTPDSTPLLQKNTEEKIAVIVDLKTTVILFFLMIPAKRTRRGPRMEPWGMR